MLGHFPIPYPDEMLYGACARAFAYTDPPSKKGFCEMLFGPGAIAVCDIPSRLESLTEQLPPSHPSTAESFLNKNTLLPLFLPFLPTERAQRCRMASLSNGGKKIPFLTGIMASRLKQPSHLRLCPHCYTENEQNYGEAYWHRSHQIEGVDFCHHHKLTLVKSAARRLSRHNRHEFHRPTLGWREIGGKPSEENTRLAADSFWLLNQNNQHPGFTKLRRGYIEALQEKRLAHPSGRIYLSHLTEQFLWFHGKEFLDAHNCALDSEQNWLAQLVRKGRDRCAHPIQHLLLIHFLGHTAQSFFGILSAPKPRMPEIPTPNPPRIKAISASILKKLWLDHTISLREISRRLTVDPMTVKRKAVQAGLKFPRRAIRPTRKKPVSRSGQTKPKLQYHRRLWEKALRSKKPARRLHPSTYSYLFRFDRDWLDTHRPPSAPAKPAKQRVNWQERDHLLAAKAEEILKQSDTTPTPAYVHRELGIASLLRRNRHKLPLTMQTIHPSTLPKNIDEHRSFRTVLTRKS